HARLKVTAREVTITDLGSQNGTRLNGEPIDSEQALSSGDAIALTPQTTLVFHAPRAKQQAAHFLDRRQLHARLEEEVDRSTRYLRSVSVLVARWDRALELSVTHALDRALR